MGPELVIVLFTMADTDRRNRLEKRHIKKEDAKFVKYLMVRTFG